MILYYSRTQKTRVCAEALHDVTGLPLYAFESDVNQLTNMRFLLRIARLVVMRNECPIVNMPVNIPGEIYLCGPIWAGALALPVKYFLKHADLKGKKVHLLITASIATQQHRDTVLKALSYTGCIPGEVYQFATTKELPERMFIAEQLREMFS